MLADTDVFRHKSAQNYNKILVGTEPQNIATIHAMFPMDAVELVHWDMCPSTILGGVGAVLGVLLIEHAFQL